MIQNRLLAITVTLTTILLVSLGQVLSKLALADIPPFTFVWLQIAVGGAVLSIHTFLIRRERIPKGLGTRVWGYMIALGIANFTIVRVLLVFSLERLPATTHSYLVNFVGIVTMGMSIFILKESPTIFQIVGAAVAIVGLRVFFDRIPPPSELIGLLYIFAAILALAYTNNIARKLALITGNSLSNNLISTLALWAGGGVVVLSGLILDWPPPVAGWNNWGIVLYSGVIIVAFGLTVWNYILRTLRSYEASILGASSVIFTALLAIPILGERLAPNQILGIALMIGGLSLVQVRRSGLPAWILRPKGPVQAPVDLEKEETDGQICP